ncbi:MAG: serine/threonine-protein kinase [Rudaea sp.]
MSATAAVSLRQLFDEIVELPPDLRRERIGALDMHEDLRSRLRVMVAFDEMMQHAPDQRARELADANLADTERRRVRQMLDADAKVPTLLHAAASQVAQQLRVDDDIGQSLIGTRVGTFKLIELIGQGGSSVVFRAERAAGDGAQVVALKLLRTGLYSADTQRRFRREQAILAQLTHPNIASLIEGGVSQAGIPYIAMELVDGVPITLAASARFLTIEQRLTWFCTLCRTIESAHAALVVHRDLKPSNLLVTSAGELKVLDFGIAGLVDNDDVSTRTHVVTLTPEYAAPEQYLSGALTTAVDIYALGVLLGELLTGQRLAPNARASNAVAAKQLRGDSGIPSGLPPADELIRRLRGDLDAILTTALADEPRLRYRSANAFADDIERYLHGRPVRAHPPSSWYRMRKFVTRHRVGFTLAALVLVGMMSVASIAVWQGIKAKSAAKSATEQAARADSMRDFMFNAFAQAEPTKPRNGPVTVMEVVDRAIDSASKDATIEPRARAELLARLAEVVGTQGDLKRSGNLLATAYEHAADAFGANDFLTSDIVRLQALNAMMRGELPQARNLIDGLIARLSPLPIELQGKILLDSAAIARHEGNSQRSQTDARRAVSLARASKNSEKNSDLLLSALDELGAVLLAAELPHDAIDVYEEVVVLDRARFGEQSNQLADALSGLSRAYRRLDDFDRAEQYARAALAIDKAIYPGDHWITANHLNALGVALKQKRDLGGALDAFREALRISEATFGEDHPDTIIALQSVATTEMQLEDFAHAIPRLRRALSANIKRFGEHAFLASLIRADYGYALAMNGDRATGINELELAIADFQVPTTSDWDLLGRALEKRIRIALEENDASTALQRIDPLAETLTHVREGDSYWAGRAEYLRGEILLALGRAVEAEAALAQSAVHLASAKAPEAVLYTAQPLLHSAVWMALGNVQKSREMATLGRERLQKLTSPPARLLKLEATLPR